MELCLLGDNGVDRIEFIYWSFIKKNTVGKFVLILIGHLFNVICANNIICWLM